MNRQNTLITNISQDDSDSFIKGGEIQVVPTSGTTTVTQEMANIVIPRTQIQSRRPYTANQDVVTNNDPR